MNGELTLDSILSRRLSTADRNMASPSSGRATGAFWHGDDGLDSITVSSGYTDAPLNLNVLNQMGPEYSGVAHSIGATDTV